MAAVGIASLVFTSSGTAQQASTKIPFARLGAELFESSGIDASKTPAQLRLALLDKHFVRVSIGLFDVRFPIAHLQDRRHAASFAAAADALIRIQEPWVNWAAGTVDRSVRADAATLRKWIRSWRPKQLAQAATGDEREVLALIRTRGEQVAAVTRFATFLRCQRWLNDESED